MVICRCEPPSVGFRLGCFWGRFRPCFAFQGVTIFPKTPRGETTAWPWSVISDVLLRLVGPYPPLAPSGCRFRFSLRKSRTIRNPPAKRGRIFSAACFRLPVRCCVLHGLRCAVLWLPALALPRPVGPLGEKIFSGPEGDAPPADPEGLPCRSDRGPWLSRGLPSLGAVPVWGLPPCRLGKPTVWGCCERGPHTSEIIR